MTAFALGMCGWLWADRIRIELSYWTPCWHLTIAWCLVRPLPRTRRLESGLEPGGGCQSEL